MKKISRFQIKKKELEFSRVVELFCHGEQQKPISTAGLKRFMRINKFKVSEISVLRYIKFKELRNGKSV
ncbi:MAG: hypothetical protein WC665_05560 [Sulfurimonas sp.]|jgi:hypothetical protein